MQWIERNAYKTLLDALQPQKVVILLGPRRVGKTELLLKVKKKFGGKCLRFNGEDGATRLLFERRTIAHFQELVGDHRLLLIDEAQHIPQIGAALKLMVDEIPKLSVLVTGSSAFDLANDLGEPLTGRKKTIFLFPVSEKEARHAEHPTQWEDRQRERLIYGCYPEIVQQSSRAEKVAYLKELVSSYLFRDILKFENLKNSDKILKLLRLIAFQVGNEVSYHELGKQLDMSKNTVERYLDLLSKVFVIFKIGGYSRNLRKEVTKSSKWYFYDNGVRNTIIANLSAPEMRNDMGALWENYAIMERVKHQGYSGMLVNNYFWRTYDRQEIDWVEERGGNLFAYEMKWSNTKKPRVPRAFANAYPEAEFKSISPGNLQEWITEPAF